MSQLPGWSRDTALLLGRIAVGAVFIAHGLQKFLQWGMAGTAASFADMGIPLPTVAAWASALIETVGGLALLLGLALPIAGVLLACNMLGALVYVHISQGLFVSGGGFEFVLVLAMASLALGFSGGSLTLDRFFSGARREPATS